VIFFFGLIEGKSLCDCRCVLSSVGQWQLLSHFHQVIPSLCIFLT